MKPCCVYILLIYPLHTHTSTLTCPTHINAGDRTHTGPEHVANILKRYGFYGEMAVPNCIRYAVAVVCSLAVNLNTGWHIKFIYSLSFSPVILSRCFPLVRCGELLLAMALQPIRQNSSDNILSVCWSSTYILFDKRASSPPTTFSNWPGLQLHPTRKPDTRKVSSKWKWVAENMRSAIINIERQAFCDYIYIISSYWWIRSMDAEDSDTYFVGIIRRFVRE